MNNKYILQINPFVVPTNDGKSIKEHFGLASTGETGHSIAHMIAPPKWGEPYQTPEFDEITFVFRGHYWLQHQILLCSERHYCLHHHTSQGQIFPRQQQG